MGRDGYRATVTLTDDTRAVLSIDAVLELGLRIDARVDAATRSRMEREELRFRARDSALRLLGARARSRRELSDRLRRKELPRDLIDQVLDDLVKRGLLNDADFARAWVRDRLRMRPRGRRALGSELARKGVAREVVDRVLDEVFQEMETSDDQVAERVAASWLRRQPDKIRNGLLEGPRTEAGARAWRRGLGHLARKGFGGGAARSAIERALEQAR